MTHSPRIAIPVPTSFDPAYNERCWAQYARAVEQCGGIPVAVALDQEPSAIARLASGCSGILLPGSPADIHPQKYGAPTDPRTSVRDTLREAADELLLQDAFNLHKPIFGICYGHQSINVWKGGTLVQHLETAIDHEAGPSVDEAHSLALSSSAGHLSQAFAGSEPAVNSSHHQAVDVVGDGLSPAATSPEDGVVEACEAAEGFVLGVQWHPERTFASHLSSRRLFEQFVAAAAAWHEPDGAAQLATGPA